MCDGDVCFRKIIAAKEDIRVSGFYDKLVPNLKTRFKRQRVIDIVSYGLGQYSKCVSARYQFAFLLLLKDYYEAQVFVYDPIFSHVDIEIAKHFDCIVLDFNEEGKRQVILPTVFFLPHCPKQLTNNILWKNWGKGLSECVIIGNSFEKIIESNSDRILKESLLYVFHASTFVTELKIDNCFRFQDIFNDLSVHFFLEEDIELLPDNILSLKEEPSYPEEDLEFVTLTISNNFNI